MPTYKEIRMAEITEEELRKKIVQAVAEYDGQKALAKAIGISTTYINNIIRHGNPISNTVSEFFGYRLVKKYVQEEQK
jgi:plasmid maintenance system antidote protein VapI